MSRLPWAVSACKAPPELTPFDRSAGTKGASLERGEGFGRKQLQQGQEESEAHVQMFCVDRHVRACAVY